MQCDEDDDDVDVDDDDNENKICLQQKMQKKQRTLQWKRMLQGVLFFLQRQNDAHSIVRCQALAPVLKYLHLMGIE